MPVAIRATGARGRRYRGSGTVYLLHFATPYQHARHYVGYTDNLPARLAEHSAGSGARLLAAVAAAGIGFELAWTWPHASRTFERKIHGYKRTPELCPICARTDARATRYTPRTPTVAPRRRTSHTGAVA
jgi:predicted GIY-YIG superfamily endonuclease